MVPKGTAFDFTVSGGISNWKVDFTEAQVRGEIESALRRAPLDLLDLSVSVTSRSIMYVPDAYTSTVRVRTRVDHGLANDVKLIVRGAYWEAMGIEPTITSGATFAPGSKDADKPPAKPFDFAAWFRSLFPEMDLSTSIALGVIGVAVIVLVLAADD